MFIEFDIEYHSQCSFDSLKIIDTNGKELFFGCGNFQDTTVPALKEFPSVIETDLGVTIIFKTDSSGTRKGFKIRANLIVNICLLLYYHLK